MSLSRFGRRSRLSAGVLLLLALWTGIAGAFPTTSVIDDCNRTEDPLSQGGAWTNRISSLDNDVRGNGTGCVLGTAGGAFGSAFRTVASGADAESFLTITTLPATGEVVEVWVRIADGATATPDGYFLDVAKTAGSATWTLWKSVDGAQTDLTAASPVTQAISAGDSIGIEVIGDNIKGYLKTGGSWSLIISTTGGSAVTAAGSIGFVVQQTTAVVDDIGGGTVVAGGGGTTPSRMLRGFGP